MCLALAGVRASAPLTPESGRDSVSVTLFFTVAKHPTPPLKTHPSGSQFEGTVHHAREGMAAGVRCWSYCAHRQEAGRDER